VTRKITRGLARIKTGLEECLYLGNLNALRDWGHARDYVRAQWLMLQQKAPTDYVIATGQQSSVRAFVEAAAAKLGFAIEWRGTGIDEKGIDAVTGRTLVRIDARYFRPTEADSLLGDASKARAELGWTPEIGFESLVTEMVAADLALAERDALVEREGYAVLRQHE
jgi:GDPmannose 4,6-dehydratase